LAGNIVYYALQLVDSYIEAVAIFATIMDVLRTKMTSLPRLYLDHAATTPMVAAARDAMIEGMERWANPSSPHADGRAARAALEDARARIANALQWSGEVIFTSGASEAIKLGLHDCASIVTSPVEHDAVLAVSAQAERLAVDEHGAVSGLYQSGTRYAIQSANNETGVMQSLEEIYCEIKLLGSILLTDSSQSAGKLALPDADMIAVSAHKLGGPPGIGALLVKDLSLLSPTGGQEKGYRRGTENLPAVLGFAASLENGYAWMATAQELRANLDASIKAAGGEIVAENANRIATIASCRMPGVSASSQLIAFDMAGISVSAGSACSSGTLKTSHVLTAMGWDAKSAGEVIRVSFGPHTSQDDVDRFMATWRAIATRNGVTSVAI
jgi:cysteine desulfurase